MPFTLLCQPVERRKYCTFTILYLSHRLYAKVLILHLSYSPHNAKPPHRISRYLESHNRPADTREHCTRLQRETSSPSLYLTWNEIHYEYSNITVRDFIIPGACNKFIFDFYYFFVRKGFCVFQNTYLKKIARWNKSRFGCSKAAYNLIIYSCDQLTDFAQIEGIFKGWVNLFSFK